MARIRTATEDVYRLTQNDIDRALRASRDAASTSDFYGKVGMRNPSRSNWIQDGGIRHSLKAVLTYALQQHRPDRRATDFHAADGVRRLRDLGVSVVHENERVDAERERVLVERLARKGQGRFRTSLIDLYRGCPLSGCTTIRVLEAAHVDPVASHGLDRRDNGILLRADLHRLFDADLLAIDPISGRVSLAPVCEADYGNRLSDMVFVPPKNGPSLGNFANRWRDHQALVSAADREGGEVTADQGSVSVS